MGYEKRVSELWNVGYKEKWIKKKSEFRRKVGWEEQRIKNNSELRRTVS